MAADSMEEAMSLAVVLMTGAIVALFLTVGAKFGSS